MASFDENGKYIKTNWKAGDKITATKLNKIEESIEAVNDNDISRHVEADARLDALEAKDVAHDKEFTNVKNTIADNKAAAELGDYEINSRMTFLENELNEGIEEVHNVAETVDGKIATAQANMTSAVNQGKADMEAMVAEVEADLEGLHAKNDELSEQLAHKASKNFFSVKDFGAIGDGETDDTEAIQECIDYCSEHNDEFYTVFFPDGKYLVNGNLHIKGNIRLKGTYSNPGWTFGHYGSVIYCKTDSEEPLINYQNDDREMRYGFVIEDLAIYGDYTNPPKRDVIHNIKGGWEFLMRNVFIRFFKGHALYGFNLYDSVIENCSFIDCSLNEIEGEYKYTVKLTDDSVNLTDASNAIKFTNCHFEHSRIFVDLDKAREVIFTSCKFENATDNNGVNELPTFRIGDRSYNNIFNACTFMCVTDLNNYLFEDPVQTISCHYNFLVINGCTFVNGNTRNGKTGVRFMNLTRTKTLISNCAFSMCNGDYYPFILDNANISNCDFVFSGNTNKELQGLKISNTIMSNCKLYVHEDSQEFDYISNDILNIGDNCVLSNITWDSAYKTNSYPKNLQYYTTNEFNSSLLSKYGITIIDDNKIAEYDGNNFKLPLNEFCSNVFVFTSSEPVTITGLTSGFRGEEVTFYNEGSGTISFENGWNVYDGTTFRNAAEIATGKMARYKKVTGQWILL